MLMMIRFLWLFPLLGLPPSGSPVMLVVRSRGGALHPLSQTLQPEGRVVLHRSKRDWMWRQFFLSEEYMGNNYQYVGKLRSDKDRGDGTARYVLSGEGAGTIFRIDEKSGDLHATQRLDREEKASYTLQAQAFNKNTGLPLEPATEFIVKIHDINDNEPKFTKDVYAASVPEMSDVGTFVIEVNATDADDASYGNSARLVYSILQGQPYFSVEPETGLASRLCLKEGSVASQGESIASQQMRDYFQIIRSYHLSAYESAEIGFTVGRIKANDGDEGENAEMKYRIVDGDGKDSLDIITDEITQEGVIVVRKQLDYESRRVYTIKVEVSNTNTDPNFLHLGPFSDTATVKVTAKDVDEPPVFSRPQFVIEVNEDTPKGSIIGTVTAWDPDSTDYPVQIALSNMDREVRKEYQVVIQAKDMAGQMGGLSGTTMVNVTLTDVNDSPPRFINIIYIFLLFFQIIQTISAIDTDEPLIGHKFVFSLSATNPNFTIFDNEDNTARILTRRSGFNRQDVSAYYLPVVISDNDYPIQSSTSTLTIRVCGCDSSGSMRSCSVDALLLSAGLSTGALVAILLCIVILLMIVVLFSALRKQRRKEPLIISKEDVRDNVVSYNDEGGGEEDTQAFDIGTLRHPEVMESNKMRRDIIPEMLFPYHRPSPMNECSDVRDFISSRLQENDTDPSAPPYDSLATYAYEGNGSTAESLSSLESSLTEGDHEYDYLSTWGPQFKKLADMYIGKDTGTSGLAKKV
uniref:Cadherin-6 n=1 Tax=Astyanax mexicanus TaxID=7994 RepID=A0A8B9GPZ9_ASTMX